MATVHVFTNGQMNYSIAPTEKARVMVAVDTDYNADGYSREDWKTTLGWASSQEGGHISGAIWEAVAMNDPNSAYPTMVFDDVDLLYPFLDLAVYWAGAGDPPPFTVNAWIITP